MQLVGQLGQHIGSHQLALLHLIQQLCGSNAQGIGHLFQQTRERLGSGFQILHVDLALAQHLLKLVQHTAGLFGRLVQGGGGLGHGGKHLARAFTLHAGVFCSHGKTGIGISSGLQIQPQALGLGPDEFPFLTGFFR